MAQLPPVQFQRPYRQPSPLEAVFTRAIGGFLERKLVTEPIMEKQQRHDISERLWNFHLGLSAEEQAHEKRKELKEREADMQASADVRRYLELPGAAREVAEGFEQGRPVEASQTGVIEEYFDFLGIPKEERAQMAPGNYRAANTLIGDLGNLAAAREQRASRLAQASRSDLDWMIRLLPQLDQTIASLPPVLVKDEQTGELRFPTDDEQRLRAFGGAVSAGELIGYENDPRVVKGRQRINALENRLVTLPAYDPELEVQTLGRIARPDDQGAAMLSYLYDGLARARLAGGDPRRGEDLWFINDRGERVDVKNKSELLTKLPQQARGRLRGVMWAEFFNLRDEERFKAAQTAYDLTDPAAVETRARLLGTVTAPTSADDEGAPLEVGSAARRQRERRGPTFASPAAAQFAQNADARTAAQVAYYAERMVEDPSYYDTALQDISDLVTLTDEEYRAALAELAPEAYAPTAEGIPSRGLRVTPQLPSKQRLQFELTKALEIAQQEATVRRRQQQPSPAFAGAGGQF